MTSNLIYRDVSESITAIDTGENKTVKFSFASETPHERIDWESWELISEILDCRAEAIVGERLENGLIQYLWNHNRDQVRGVIKEISWKNGKGDATAKLSRTAEAEELYRNIQDGITKGVSVGYKVYKYEVLAPAVWGGDRWDSTLITPKQVKAIEWEIFEISAVSIPADATVGVGRSVSAPITFNLRQIISNIGADRIKKELKNMSENDQDVRSTPQYQELDTKYRELAAEANTLRTENNSLRGQVNTLQADLAKQKQEAEFAQKYATLKGKADGLLAEAKMSAVQYQSYFERDAAALLALPNPEGELRGLEMMVEAAEKAQPMLNTNPSRLPIDTPADVQKKSATPEKTAAAKSYEQAWKKKK